MYAGDPMVSLTGSVRPMLQTPPSGGLLGALNQASSVNQTSPLINTAQNYNYPLTNSLLGSIAQGSPDYTQTALQLAGNPHAGPYATNLGTVPPATGLSSAGSTSGGGGTAGSLLGILGSLAKGYNGGGGSSSSSSLGSSVGSALNKLFGNGSGSSIASQYAPAENAYASGVLNSAADAAGVSGIAPVGSDAITSAGDLALGQDFGLGATDAASGAAAGADAGAAAGAADAGAAGGAAAGADAAAGAGAADAGASGAGAGAGAAGAGLGLAAGGAALAALYGLYQWDQIAGQYTPKDQYHDLANTPQAAAQQTQQLQQAIASGQAVMGPNGQYTINGIPASTYYPLAGLNASQINALNQPLAQNFLNDNGADWSLMNIGKTGGSLRGGSGNHSTSKA
jgi:hypothetical protein